MDAQVTGLATTFNSTALKATIFLPKNEAFAGFLSSLGLQMDQILKTSSFTPYLGQVRHLSGAWKHLQAVLLTA